ncbi:MAG: neutral zinc metallopeptidase, partial [Flavobacterium sp.]|nr:neutral zinc metallopeptidase [Flavobacterium sp.]
MKWEGRRQSKNVEDRRGMGTTGKVVAGGGLIGVVILLLNLFGGEGAQNLTPILEQLQQQSTSAPSQPLSKEDEKMGQFVATVLADTEDVWHKIFKENGMTYKEAGMVLFRGSVQSACGGATSASGPFYCPGDDKIYMDLDFFDELQTRFGAKGGDYAIAYVIAHEVGHHVQTLLGTSGKVRQLQQNMSKTEANKLSVSLELQADFYAGLWTHYNSKYLDEGDIEEALSA